MAFRAIIAKRKQIRSVQLARMDALVGKIERSLTVIERSLGNLIGSHAASSIGRRKGPTDV
jgi:hypothetical protein